MPPKMLVLALPTSTWEPTLSVRVARGFMGENMLNRVSVISARTGRLQFSAAGVQSDLKLRRTTKSDFNSRSNRAVVGKNDLSLRLIKDVNRTANKRLVPFFHVGKFKDVTVRLLARNRPNWNDYTVLDLFVRNGKLTSLPRLESP